MGIEVNIKKKFDGFTLDLNFHSQDKRLGILGASGSGKSITLRCIAGIVTPDSGRIAVNGRVLFDSEKKINLRPQERKVGYLFQSYALFGHMTVEENIAASMKGSRVKIRERAAALAAQFHLEGLEGRLPSQLSGGQQQRVALARMMACEPGMILLDEAFCALDIFLKERMQHEMMEFLQTYPGDAVIVTHDRDEVYQFSDTIVVTDGGKCAAMGKTKEIFERPPNYISALLTGCKNISAAKKTGEYEVFAKDWKISLKTNVRVPDTLQYVGIRAHDLQPAQSGGQNTMAVQTLSATRTPFEVLILMRGVDGGTQDIWWKLPREKRSEVEKDPAPGFLRFPEESLLLLL